jgi:hypothetical protein
LRCDGFAVAQLDGSDVGEVEARAAALGGGGTSRRRPQSPMQRWSYGAGPWPSAVWVATWSCVGSKFVDPAGSDSSARSLIWSLRRGGGPGFSTTFVVCGQPAG